MADVRIKHFIEEEAKPAIRNTLPKLIESMKLFEDLAGLNGSVARNNAADVVKVRVEEIVAQENDALDAEKEAKRITDKKAATKAEEKRIAKVREKAANKAEAKAKQVPKDKPKDKK